MRLEPLARRVGAALKARNGLLVTAESCTGGGVAQAVTAISGSSEWFERGFVCYSNASKTDLLGVAPGTLERHGAVSEETARDMVRGALGRSRGTLALAVTGIAGPAGGTPEKPVGLVCFAWASGDRIRSESRHFAGERESVRRQAVARALEGVLEMLDSA